jgi:hypothetical protein
MLNSQHYSVYEIPIVDSQPKALSSVAVILPLYAALIAGTGGFYAPVNVRAVSEFSVKPFITVVETRRKSDVANLIHNLAKIRSAFGLNMTEFSQVFGISRPTAYAWFQGSEPKHDLLRKIWQLSSYADEIQQIQIARIGTLLRRPLIEGKCLLDLLTEGRNIGSGISILKDLSAKDKIHSSMIHSKITRKARVYSVEDISATLSERG